MATQKAKRAAKIKLEHPEMPMGKVMLAAGYSKETSEKPQNLTESKGWQELMAEYLPDKLLAEKHKEILNSPRIVTRYVKGEIVDEYEETSPQAVKALDMAYKLKKRYSDTNINGVMIVNLSPAAASKYGINPSTDQNTGGSA